MTAMGTMIVRLPADMTVRDANVIIMSVISSCEQMAIHVGGIDVEIGRDIEIELPGGHVSELLTRVARLAGDSNDSDSDDKEHPYAREARQWHGLSAEQFASVLGLEYDDYCSYVEEHRAPRWFIRSVLFFRSLRQEEASELLVHLLERGGKNGQG